MKTNLKYPLIVLNIIIIVLAFLWLNNDTPIYEPIIVIVGQIITLLALAFEGRTLISNEANIKGDGNIASFENTGDKNTKNEANIVGNRNDFNSKN